MSRKDPLVSIDGHRLKALIDRLVGSRRQVAARVNDTRINGLMISYGGVSSQTIDYICSGKQVRCRWTVLHRLAWVLEVPEAWLAGNPEWEWVSLDDAISGDWNAVGLAVCGYQGA